MDCRLFAPLLSEKHIFKNLPNNLRRFTYVDNESVHALTEVFKKALEDSDNELRMLPKNSTEIFQPVDPFLIQNVKTEWRSMWD